MILTQRLTPEQRRYFPPHISAAPTQDDSDGAPQQRHVLLSHQSVATTQLSGSGQQLVFSCVKKVACVHDDGLLWDHADGARHVV